MNWITWAIGIAGSLSVGALIAVCIFFPATALIVWQAIAKVFWQIVSTRIGCSVLTGIAVFMAASFYQHHVDAIAEAARVASFRKAQIDRDTKIATDTEAAVRKELADEAVAQKESDDAFATYKSGLSHSPACTLGRTGAEQLRKLWGLGSPDHKSLFKAAKPRKAARGARR